MLPGGDVSGGPGHVDIGGDLDTEPGGLRGHGVSVDLTHVQAPVIQAHRPGHYQMSEHIGGEMVSLT